MITIQFTANCEEYDPISMIELIRNSRNEVSSKSANTIASYLTLTHFHFIFFYHRLAHLNAKENILLEYLLPRVSVKT